MFKKILFFTDFSENAHWAFTYALNLTKTYQGKLLILHVTPDPAFVYPDTLNAYIPKETLQKLEASEEEKMDRELNTYYVQKMNGFEDYKTLLKKGVAFCEIPRSSSPCGTKSIASICRWTSSTGFPSSELPGLMSRTG